MAANVVAAMPAGDQCEEERDRLWDILWMLRQAIKASPRNDAVLQFRFYLRNDNWRAKLVTLKAICGPDEDHCPVITIMLPGED